MGSTSGPAVPIHWTERGTGVAAVLLHGLGGDVEFWADEIEVFAESFRVIAVDLRGSGSTPASPGGHTMADLADDVVAVLDDAGVERAHVVGFSMGGLVAQSLAVRHPGRVDRLVLASTFAVMNAQARRFLDAVHEVYAREASAKVMFELICPWLFSPAFLADAANEPSLRYDDDSIDQDEMRRWSAAYAAQRAFDVRGQLHLIGAPTLVLAGEQDALVTLADATFLAEGIPSSRLEIVHGAGHLTNVENPEAFRAAVLEHLS